MAVALRAPIRQTTTGFEEGIDLEVAGERPFRVHVDVATRIDDRGDAGLFVGDEIGDLGQPRGKCGCKARVAKDGTPDPVHE